MIKISKEQSEFLANRIYEETLYLTREQQEIRHAIMGVLDECTEKEFPNFKICHQKGCVTQIDMCDSGSLSLWINDEIYETSSMHLPDRFNITYFDYKEFKAFTDGCIAIVKFLEESE